MRRSLACLALAIGLLLGIRTIAYAHAMLVSADPSAGSAVAVSPPRVRLVFSEPLEVSFARLSLVATDGSITRLTAAGDPRDVHAIVASVPRLAPGAYRLAWRVVSADGHPVEGSYVFTVGPATTANVGAAGGAATAPPDAHLADQAPAAWGPDIAGAPLVPAVLRGLALGSLMALAGVLLFNAWPRSDTGAAPPRAARLVVTLAIAAPVLLALHAIAWLVSASPDHALSADTITAAAAGGAGRVELWRVGLALLALWAVGLARRPGLALVFATLALVVSGGSGHPAAIDPSWTRPAKALHLLAGSAWLGGLLWLVATRPDRRDGLADSNFAREAERVSAIALAAVIIVTLSGFVQALLFLPTPRDLVRSAYGVVTLAKVAGMMGLVAFGAHHRRRVLPRLADGDVAHRFTATLRGELMLFALVILLGGLLAYLPPPSAAATADSRPVAFPSPSP